MRTFVFCLNRAAFVLRAVFLTLACIGTAETGSTSEPSAELPAKPIASVINPNRLVRVHARFAGEVIAIGNLDPTTSPDGIATKEPRRLRVGDKVNQDQVLAIIRSKEVGEKKSEFVDARSQLELDRLAVDRLKKLNQAGAVPERSLREAERKVEGDEILVAKLERTLLSWRLSEQDLDFVRVEAERVRTGGRVTGNRPEKKWDDVLILAPFSGVILEMNIAQEEIVSTNLDLFKVYAPEEKETGEKVSSALPAKARPEVRSQRWPAPQTCRPCRRFIVRRVRACRR